MAIAVNVSESTRSRIKRALLLATIASSNDWKLLSTFELSAVARALEADQWRGAIEAFGACAMVINGENIYVAGIVDAGKQSWGAVLRVDRDGRLSAVGHGVPEGLWVLERAPDGALWAGGHGAYRLRGSEWVSAWSASRPGCRSP